MIGRSNPSFKLIDEIVWINKNYRAFPGAADGSPPKNA